MNVFSYEDLPLLAKKALHVYPYLDREDYNKVAYALETIPIEDAINRCMSYQEINEMYASFDLFHQEYVAAGDVPIHQEQYPVFEDTQDDYEWLIDGWHRFHSYYMQGFRYIPVIRIV